MKVGFGVTDITPPIGAEMPGGFLKRFNTGVHDPLQAKAALLDDGESRTAIVQLDCLSIKRSVVDAARSLANEWCGIALDRVMVAASHTHAGGPTSDCLGSESDPAYLRFVSQRIAQAVALADQVKTDARLSVDTGHEDSVAFNRRFWMKGGAQATHPGKGNPDIAKGAGPIDPSVGVVSAWAVNDGRLLGCIVNFTCHLTIIGGLRVSADYPFYMDQVVRGAFHPQAVTVFVNGAYGDVTQVANTIRRESESGEKWSRRVGQVLGGEVVKVLARAEPGDTLRLQGTSRVIHLCLREVTPERVAEAEALLAAAGDWNIDRGYARDVLLLAAMNQVEPQVPAEVQVLSLNEAAFVGVPAEYFCQFGLEIKAASPFPKTFIAGGANGMVAYVPTAEAMGPRGGGYEPRLARSSKLVPEAGCELQDTALALLRTLEPPDVSLPPDAPLGKPWDVGSSRADA